MTALNTLQPKVSRQSRIRVGRGIGSGKGKTCGSGHKGQKSRSGVSINGFEGGQMPIYMRLPKRGFVNPFSVTYAVVNLSDLEKFVASKKLDAKKKISNAELFQAGVVSNLNKPVKLLAKGAIKTALTLEVDAASKSAIEAIEKAGGSVTVKKA